MIHFKINEPWEHLKHQDLNCSIVNQFKMYHLCRHFDINSVLLFKRLFGYFILVLVLVTSLSDKDHIFWCHTCMV